MPKGKKKGKYEHRRTEQAYSSDEDAGIDVDNCSEISGQSDLKSIHDDTAAAAAAESEAQEKFEEKLLETVEALGARSSAARAAALGALRAALQRRPAAALLAAHRATLADHVARALRRGRDDERRAAAALAPLLALQIGDEGTEEYVLEVRPALSAAATDRTASLDTRTECCMSLAVLCYLLEDDLFEIMEVMRMFENIFSGSYLKGDGSVKVGGAAAEEGAWHAAALDAWALLLALVPPAQAGAALPARLPELLDACSVDVRVAAGGALAAAHERAEGHERAAALAAAALPRLDALARDAHKYHARRSRKLQRATFRDIVRYLEEARVPELRAQVSGESVQCSSWGARGAYGALAGALGGGLAALAPVSGPLRAALGLPAAPPARAAPAAARRDRLQRHLANNAACKARTVARNKNRDKRSAALAL